MSEVLPYTIMYYHTFLLPHLIGPQVKYPLFLSDFNDT